jgi:hypothetical protein
MPGSNRRDEIGMICTELGCCHDGPSLVPMRKLRGIAFNFRGMSHIDRAQMQAGWSNGLERPNLADAGSQAWIAQNRRSLHLWRDLF